MAPKLQKILPALTALLIAHTGLTHADTQMDENRRMPLYQPEGMMRGANEMNAPSARPYWMDTEGKMHVETGAILDVELLVWQARADDLEAGVFNTNFKNTPSAADRFKASRYTDADYEHMKFNWDVGVRLGLGYYFEHDNWDVYGAWTYFHDNAHKEIFTDQEFSGELFTTWTAVDVNLVGGGSPLVSAIDAHWKLKLNLVDLELGRQFFAGTCLVFRPHAGLRGGWINEHFSVYNGFATLENTAMKNDFKGIGVRAGLDTQWHLGSSGVCVYGDAAISILYGRYDLTAFEINAVPINLSNINNIVLDTEEKFNDSKAITDLSLGLCWQPDLSCWCETLRVTLGAGWEHHIFFNQLQLKRVSSLRHSPQDANANTFTNYVREAADLSTQGVTITLRFEF